ncbi:cytochrome C [Pelistega indica]|uniref:Cytochrome C n=1 Tax=Pelistega indica TaxID=1414851 RepID=V8FUM7_9BURK|nr:cytochrome c [Pelistega indica]ETD67423.1 cytochrome C [Pelistega indica]
MLSPLPSIAQDAQSIERGKQVAAVCAACHMPDGRGQVVANVETRPRITGLNPTYFVKQLHAFKDGTRDNVTMKPIVSMLNDEQIKDVANYFASLPVVHDTFTPQESDKELLELGQQLMTKGDWDRYIPACAQCHGENAYGSGVNFPNLNGQAPEYIKQQLEAWQKGTRNNDLLGLMKPIANRLSEKDIQAVSLWFASQPATVAK